MRKVFTFSDNYGYIASTPLIFQSSLYENLMYGNTNTVDESKITDFLKILDTFKEKYKSYDLHRKIDNKVFLRQMQKIAFIRAIIANPRSYYLMKQFGS